MALIRPIPSKGVRPITITLEAQSGAYIMIMDILNNRSYRLSSISGQTVTIGDITYTAKGSGSNYASLAMNVNGTIHTPVTDGQPNETSYTSGSTISVGNLGTSNPVTILFTPE